jgi:hypothetical protein
MSIKRRSFLALIVAAVPALLAACGATPMPTPLPRPTAQPTITVLGPAAPAGQGARFSVDRMAIDFGNVKFDKMVTAVFKVTNTGTAPLVLKVPSTVRAEVGC